MHAQRRQFDEPVGCGTGQRPSSAFATRCTAWLPILLLFLSYPVALLVPVRSGLPLTYEWSLPTFLAASGFCIVASGVLRLDVHPGMRPALRLLLLVGVGLVLWSASVADRFDVRATVTLAGCVAIPAYFASCNRTHIPAKLPLALAALWMVHVLHGVWQMGVGFSVVGVTGNRNWMAALVLALAPWLPMAVGDFLQERDLRCRRHVLWAVSGVAVLAVLLLAWQTRCRATVVALLAFGAWWAFWRIPTRTWRAAFVGILVAVCLVGTWLGRERLEAMAARDIRLPCWRGTIAMVSQSPWLGAGPGQYRREFPAYRTPAQMQRAVAGDITEHPHNQLLFLAATAGLPFAVLWLGLLIPLLAPPPRDAWLKSAHFTAFILVAHALLDKQMVQPPTDLLACITIGLVWRPFVVSREYAPPGRSGHPRGLKLARPRKLRQGWRSYAVSQEEPRAPRIVASAARPLSRLLPAGVAVLILATVGIAVDLPAGNARRTARLLERDGDYRRAVQQYTRAGTLTHDARDYLLAGTVASQHLNQPLLSLQLLIWAYNQEPYIGHLHRYLGITAGQLGQHAVALRHFELEADLFPFDDANHQLLYNARLHSELFKGLPGLHRAIGRLRLRTVLNERGSAELRRAVAAWRDAVLANQPRKAARIAHWILEPLAVDMLEPVSPVLPKAPASFRPSGAPAITQQDYELWRQWWTTGVEQPALEPNAVPFSPPEFRCRNQALAQIAAHLLPDFPLRAPFSPAARLEESFQNTGLIPSFHRSLTLRATRTPPGETRNPTPDTRHPTRDTRHPTR